MKGPAALVVRINRIDPHPDADKLETVHFEVPGARSFGLRGVATCVTGPHYKAHTEGVWFRPGAILPGWLAEEMWLSKGIKTFEVREFPIRGQLSQGIFAGGVWRKTPDGEFERWRFWKSNWTPGIDVSDYFGVWFPRPSSSVAEQPVANRTVAAKTTDTADGPSWASGGSAVEASGSTPAMGSTTPRITDGSSATVTADNEVKTP